MKNYLFKRLKKIRTSLVKQLHLHLFLTLFSAPLFLHWGLPISLFSFIGNIIFAPLITAFLLLSSILFFLECLHIPHGLFNILLEYLTSCWNFLLSFAQWSWIVAIPEPSLIISLCIPLAALVIVHTKYLSTPTNNCAALSIFLIIAYAWTYVGASHEIYSSIDCFEKKITLIHTKKVCIIDQGALGRRISAPATVRQKMIPTLIKKGITTVDHVIIVRPSICTFKALIALMQSLRVKNIYLPSFKATFKNRGWSVWEQFLMTAKFHGTNILSVTESRDMNLELVTIHLRVELKKIKKNNLSYHPISIAINSALLMADSSKIYSNNGLL